MAFNGSGTFVLNHDWVTEAAGSYPNIEAARMADQDSDIAAGLSNCITKDGQTTITGNINFGSHAILGITTITASSNITTSAGTITATAGNIVATAGSITATAGDISAGDDITAGGDITATGTVSGATVTASGTVSGATVSSSGNVTAGGYVGGDRFAGDGSATASVFVQSGSTGNIIQCNANSAARLYLSYGVTGAGESSVVSTGTVLALESTQVVRSLTTYNNTTGVGANVVVNSSGNLARSTSVAAAKNIQGTVSTEEAIAFIKNVDGKRYKSKLANDDPDLEMDGFVAEDVQGHAPRLCTFDEGGLTGVSYDRVPVYHHAALQDILTRLEALEA